MARYIDIPGFLEAVSEERLIRDAAFLPVLESINGFECKPLTLTHYMILRMVGSPFIPPFREATPVDLATFLWVVSPGYNAQDSQARTRFVKRCLPFTFAPDEPLLFRHRWWKRVELFAATAKAARTYTEEALMDSPASAERSGFTPEYYSDAAFFCDLFGSEYRYTPEVVMNTPLKCLFQLMNTLQERHIPRERLLRSNPRSGRVVSDYLAAQNKMN